MKYISIILSLVAVICCMSNVFRKQQNIKVLKDIGSEEIVEDSLDFVIFFKRIIRDKDARESSFRNCKSELLKELNNRLDQLDDYISYRSEVSNTDNFVNVIFYNNSLNFYKANFSKYNNEWILMNIDCFNDRNLYGVLNSLRIEKKRIVYDIKCIDQNFVGELISEGKTDTLHHPRNLLAYSFSNSFLFYAEGKKNQKDFMYRFIGLGSGINGYAYYKNDCLVKYWDSSN